ncbi:MAG TPA: hydrogenase maturation nickel metallochaperone HypA [Bacteroidales bacterium]|nr:hydrogenase maturation nickel metallochaperone HypA [Bacteroidales bacterium]
MHELRIAEDLTAIVLETAEREHLVRVTRVNISFGQMIQIVPDIFEFAFREIVCNTIARDAELVIEIVPVKMKCLNCGYEFHVRENLFACHNCSSTDLEIINGKELFIKSIEGEQIWK